MSHNIIDIQEQKTDLSPMKIVGQPCRSDTGESHESQSLALNYLASRSQIEYICSQIENG